MKAINTLITLFIIFNGNFRGDILVMVMDTCYWDKGGMVMMGESEGRRTWGRGERRESSRHRKISINLRIIEYIQYY